MTPEHKALAAIGLTVDDVILRLRQYSKPATPPRWIVRWQGRMRAMDGTAVFSSAESARDGARKWLRETLRHAVGSITHYRTQYGDPLPPGMLPGNFGYTKSYRTYVDALLSHLESIGLIQYVEIEPALRAPDQVVANG